MYIWIVYRYSPALALHMIYIERSLPFCTEIDGFLPKQSLSISRMQSVRKTARYEKVKSEKYAGDFCFGARCHLGIVCQCWTDSVLLPNVDQIC